MSCSKPLPHCIYDVLCYLKREQLERFSIVCCSLKDFIDRYFHSKPYRVFDGLQIRGGSYALYHHWVYWHPNRDDYSVQQFLAGQKSNMDRAYFSFGAMIPYLGPTLRIKNVVMYIPGDSAYSRNQIAGDSTYNSEHIQEMESISYLWRDGEIHIENADYCVSRTTVFAKHFRQILNSPTILQCRELILANAHFPFKDYKILYAVKAIETCYYRTDEIDLWQQYWQQFLEQPGAKPVVFFRFLRNEVIDNLLYLLSKAFSSAVLPNAFKIVFLPDGEPLTEFRETNNTSRERLELKKGLPLDYQDASFKIYRNYTLERSSI